MVEPQLVLANDSISPAIFPIHNMLENLGGKQTEKGTKSDFSSSEKICLRICHGLYFAKKLDWANSHFCV